jgi:hypothetical protein
MTNLDNTVGKKVEILLPNMKVADVDSVHRPLTMTDTSGKIGEIMLMKGEEVILNFSYHLRMCKLHHQGYFLRVIEGGNAAAASNGNPALILPPGAQG